MAAIQTLKLGATRDVPALCLGTWSWGDKVRTAYSVGFTAGLIAGTMQFWGYKPEQYPEIKEAWLAAIDAGIPFFDTAEAYVSI